MSEIFGIDLGTTYSAVARLDDFGLPVVIPNHADQATTPSAVYFETADNVAVGETAKHSAVVDADNVVTLIKRQMGEDFKVSYYDNDYTPESISALILKQLMKDAVAQSNIDTNRVIITVPAYFGAKEKDSTRKAGEIAGLEVVDIVAEPVAAALAYGMKQSDGEKTIFVYDLGGGTFDTTILKIAPDLLDVVVIDGNRELGGADWDARLAEHLISEFQSQTGIPVDELQDESFLQDIALKAEDLKKRLSELESRTVALRFGSSAKKIVVTRQQFEELTADLLTRTIDIVQRTLDAAQQKEPGLRIDEVLLVGGSSFMPAVKETLKTKFGWDAKLSDPNQSVAKGAAIYGRSPIASGRDGDGSRAENATTGKSLPGHSEGTTTPEVPTREIRTVIPKAIGVGVWCGHEPNEACEHSDGFSDKLTVSFFIHKNESLPFTKKETFGTASDGQTAVEIHLFEQAGEVESELIADNKKLTPASGALITGLPSLPKNSPIEIQLDITKQGETLLSAKELTTGKELSIPITVGVMQSDEVDAAKKRISIMKVDG